MADLTPNFNLEKAKENEYYDVGVHARNMDKIDTALKTNEGAVDDLAGEGRTIETVKGNTDAITAHLTDDMPHQFIDNGTTYRWGLSVENGVVMLNYEEVV